MPCGFIRKYYRRVIHKCPGYCNPLLLSAGKLIRMMVFSPFKTYAFECRNCLLSSFFSRKPVIEHRKLDIFDGRRSWKQVISLEDKAYLFVPYTCKLIPVEITNINIL